MNDHWNAMHNILLVEDSEECRLIVNKTLNHPELTIVNAVTMTEALSHLQKGSIRFDLVLLDLGLPDGNGLDLLSFLQEDNLDIPVYLMTSKEDLASKVSAFSLGAEDYLTKPVNPIELRARVEMRLRKNAKQKHKAETFRRGSLLVNVPMMKVSVVDGTSERAISLTAKEFRILTFLLQHEGRVYSRGQLLEALWGDNTHVIERTIDSHICGLRKKLGKVGHYIENVPGAGYRLNVK
ncbi:MAG: response regulator transcription factor [Calothrix sp. SM1_5_4]|nr:response regulator transcription factor [Calothrix sp. SM1_5_4]